ncbi:hypothetical protein FNV43_RR27292 [Rhamnella rubrinervis]|uniref:BRCT domain-containing protein n=1 Tax=Rhamnella rubrinervis TaxID=2594499 RepID=A0A8K0GKG7_9ROSA|nr:hypothetical protein FNV43_RR27292 [Rhamnella rubrinervis]
MIASPTNKKRARSSISPIPDVLGGKVLEDLLMFMKKLAYSILDKEDKNKKLNVKVDITNKEALKVVEPNFIVAQLDEVNLETIYPVVMAKVSGTSSLKATTEAQLGEANAPHKVATETDLLANIGIEGKTMRTETSTTSLEMEGEKQMKDNRVALTAYGGRLAFNLWAQAFL